MDLFDLLEAKLGRRSLADQRLSIISVAVVIVVTLFFLHDLAASAHSAYWSIATAALLVIIPGAACYYLIKSYTSS